MSVFDHFMKLAHKGLKLSGLFSDLKTNAWVLFVNNSVIAVVELIKNWKKKKKKKKKEKEKMQEGVKHLLNFDKYAKYVNSLLYF